MRKTYKSPFVEKLEYQYYDDVVTASLNNPTYDSDIPSVCPGQGKNEKSSIAHSK
ncbi:MAG: hypothetical protein HUJ56_08410 [Erysipelotrichaceae bacterium]|nr:hypothetical protein [Erysipelotrichaceae bacterium]